MKSRAGFSLVEIMLVLAIASIALALAYPAMMRSVQARRLAVQAESLAGFLAQVRRHAVLENRPLGVSADRERASLVAPLAGLSWPLPEGSQIEFDNQAGPKEKMRRWLLVHPNGFAQGQSALFCRQRGACWEIGMEADGRIFLRPSDKRAGA